MSFGTNYGDAQMMNIDDADVLRMLVGIIKDPNTRIPATCVLCKDRAGNIIPPSKALFYAEELLKRHDEGAASCDVGKLAGLAEHGGQRSGLSFRPDSADSTAVEE